MKKDYYNRRIILKIYKKPLLCCKKNLNTKLLAGQEQEILSLLSNYAKTLTLLEQYDKEKIALIKKAKGKFILKEDEADEVIQILKKNLLPKRKPASCLALMQVIG